MQFNSFEFIFIFLPITIILFFSAAAMAGTRTAVAVLAIASLFYYGWWEPVYLLLISGSILFNYTIGYLLIGKSRDRFVSSKILLIVGICGNLGLLGYFKYANFFVENYSLASGVEVNLPPIILPIAISFFTFQQIAYLVDCRRQEAGEYSFMNYVLFVTFFPQLLAGPIVHHKEMMPQFSNPGVYRVRLNNLAVGLAIFAVGILKKVVIADQIAPLSDSVFNGVHGGAVPLVWEAWAGAFAFTFQLYFDFSAYSDMAIGLAYMMGIVLPLNFFSPYKAINIVDFWRRWHITLSRFLRDYLYIPIGGNRHGAERRYLNILITMVIGGLWHGASWTFVCWGAYHGLLILLNHAWHAVLRKVGFAPGRSGKIASLLACSVTFLCVVVGWVFFRAENFSDAATMLSAMFGGGASYSVAGEHGILVEWQRHLAWLLALLAIVWLAPNTYQLFARFNPALVPANLRSTVGQAAIRRESDQPPAGDADTGQRALLSDTVQFIQARFSLIALILMVISYVMLGAIFFNPGQIPNTFIYSTF